MRSRITLLLILFFGLTVTLQAEVWDPDVIPVRGVDFYSWNVFSVDYAGVPWEIKNVIEHQDGYLGAHSVHDTFDMGFTVGIVGGKASGNVKSFPHPVAKVWVYDEAGNFDYIWDPTGCSN